MRVEVERHQDDAGSDGNAPLAIGLGVAIGIPTAVGILMTSWYLRKRRRIAALEKELKRRDFVID